MAGVTANAREKQLFDLFVQKRAVLEGHFILSSGRHSDQYMQSALLLQEPPLAEDLGRRIADLFQGAVNVVVSPAIGGLVIGHEVARAKGCRAIFVEKDKDGKPVLRRGFDLQPDEKALVIEDVITTGLSTAEVVALVASEGADIVGIGSIVNRSGAADPSTIEKLAQWKRPVKSLLNLKAKSWAPEACELCKKGIPAVKPGSRRT